MVSSDWEKFSWSIDFEGGDGAQKGKYGKQARQRELNEKGFSGWKYMMYVGSSADRGIILLCAWRYAVEDQARKVSYTFFTEGLEYHQKTWIL